MGQILRSTLQSRLPSSHLGIIPHSRGLSNALTISEKVDGIGHTAPTMADEESIPSGSQDDTYLVRLAAETGAVLVTTDGASSGRPGILRDSIQVQLDCGLSRRCFGIFVVRSQSTASVASRVLNAAIVRFRMEPTRVRLPRPARSRRLRRSFGTP